MHTKNKKMNFFIANKGGKISGNIIFLIAPAATLALFLILFAIKEIAPFGNYVYLSSDMYHQYCPFFAELSEKLHTGGSLLYSWNIGLGTEFTALFAYYLSSPLNFLMLFLPKAITPAFMDAIIVVKMMIASFTFALYTSKRFNSKSIFICVFAVFYSMSGYIAAFAWNIMWLDCVALFPLVILGLDRLVNDKKPFLFALSLGLSILFNYYISIMVILSSVIYFICLLFTYEKEGERYGIIKRIGLFVTAGVIAVGISAVLLLPEIYAFNASASSSSLFPTRMKAYHSLLQELARHMVFSPSYTWLEHYPNVYCGVFSVILLPIFFLSSKIPVKEKISKGVILGIFLFSFMFNIPEYIWHGFHFPNCLPARQSFIYIFFVLVLGFEALWARRKEGFKSYELIISAILCFLYLFVTGYLYKGSTTVANEDEFSYSIGIILLNAVFIASYFVLILLFRKKGKLRIIITSATLALSFTECGLHMFSTGLGLVSYTEYIKNDDSYAYILDRIKAEDDSFFRFDQDSARTANDGAWYSYHSVNTFSSTSPAGVSDFYRACGSKASMNAYQRLGATQMLDMLLSSKYIISNVMLSKDDPLREYLFDYDGIYVYKNLLVLPLGFSIPDSLAGDVPEETAGVRNSLNYQTTLFEGATHVSNLFTESVKIAESDASEATLKEDGHFYMIMHEPLLETVQVTINQGEVKSFSDLKSHNRVIDIGYAHKGDILRVEADSKVNATIYRMDTDKLIEGYNKLNLSGLAIDSIDDTSLSGEFSVENDGAYIFSIPYDKGWSVYVDGRKVFTYPGLGAFLCTNVSAGRHKIELRYFPEGLKAGALISIISVAVLVTMAVLSYKVYGNKRRKRRF